jgi:hypothetical protein
VVVVVSQSHYKMVNSNLLYTVLTRARKRAVIADSGGLVSRVTNVQAVQSLGRVRIGTSHRRASGGIWSTRRGVRRTPRCCPSLAAANRSRFAVLSLL